MTRYLHAFFGIPACLLFLVLTAKICENPDETRNPSSDLKTNSEGEKTAEREGQKESTETKGQHTLEAALKQVATQQEVEKRVQWYHSKAEQSDEKAVHKKQLITNQIKALNKALEEALEHGGDVNATVDILDIGQGSSLKTDLLSATLLLGYPDPIIHALIDNNATISEDSLGRILHDRQDNALLLKTIQKSIDPNAEESAQSRHLNTCFHSIIHRQDKKLLELIKALEERGTQPDMLLHAAIGAHIHNKAAIEYLISKANIQKVDAMFKNQFVSRYSVLNHVLCARQLTSQDKIALMQQIKRRLAVQGVGTDYVKGLKTGADTVLIGYVNTWGNGNLNSTIATVTEEGNKAVLLALLDAFTFDLAMIQELVERLNNKHNSYKFNGAADREQAMKTAAKTISVKYLNEANA